MTTPRAADTQRGAPHQGSLAKNPILLVGGATRTVARLAGHPHLGRLTQPRSGNRIEDLATCGLVWGADNDALAGLDVDAYLTMIDTIAQHNHTTLRFVTAPDAATMTPTGPQVSWEGTLWLWRSWRTALQRRTLPLAIVLQDGATVESVPWNELRAVFLGGSTAWKESAAARALLSEAQRRGLWRHIGRINTQRRERLLWPHCESFDGGQYSRWPDTHIPPCLARLATRQHRLFEEEIL
jgi:hypothetical protein